MAKLKRKVDDNMRKIVSLIIVGFLFYFPSVKADLIEETNNYINRIDTEFREFNQTLGSLNNYFDANKIQIAESLDKETLKQIGELLETQKYKEAFTLLETTLNDTNLSNLNVSNKIDKYFDLKFDLIDFVKNNKQELSIETGDQYLECSLELYDQIKDSFDLLKPNISKTIEKIGDILTEVLKIDLKANENIKSSEMGTIIEEYNELAKIVSNIEKSVNNSLLDYKEVFEVIGGDEELFNAIIKKKIGADLKNSLDKMSEALKEPINEFIQKRWDILEENVTEITESEKTIPEKK